MDLAGYARCFGAEGHTVREPDGLAPAMEAALASDTVTLLDVITDPDIISPSTTLSEIAGGRT